MLSGKYDQPVRSILLMAKACIMLSVVIGVIVTIIYCGTIGFYPGGLSIGETLFFVAASLAFAAAYTIVVLVALSSGVTVSPLLRVGQKPILLLVNARLKARGNKRIKFGLDFPPLGIDSVPYILFGLLFITFSAIKFSEDFNSAFSLTLMTLSMGIVYGAWNTKPRMREYKEGVRRRMQVGLAIIAYCLPLMLIQDKGNILNQSMTMIGVRSEENRVQLSKKHTEFLTENDVFYDDISNEGKGIYSEVTILFRGVGRKVVLKIQGFSMAVPSDDVIIGQ